MTGAVLGIEDVTLKKNQTKIPAFLQLIFQWGIQIINKYMYLFSDECHREK